MTGPWRKSSFSGGAGECVEVAFLPEGVVGVRDSKARHAALLLFGEGEWSEFLDRVKAGDCDLETLRARAAGDGSTVDGRSGSQKVPTAGVGVGNE